MENTSSYFFLVKRIALTTVGKGMADLKNDVGMRTSTQWSSDGLCNTEDSEYHRSLPGASECL